jgi:aerobic carbon-monoxide dehydrogenase medium subunit
MYPTRFEYFAPNTLEEALSLANTYSDDCKVLSGGMSLIPMMKLRFASPAVIIDLNRIPGLDYLEEANGHLHIGALLRNRSMVRSELVRARYPTVAGCAPLISDPVVRNRGTFVGSVCHADPQGDWGAVMLAMDGEIVARSVSGERVIPAESFIIGPFQNSMNDNEIAVEARLPAPGERTSGTYLKLERKVGDFATVGVAVYVSTSGGSVTNCGIALTGVGPQNIKCRQAESAVIGSTLNEGSISAAANAAAQESQPKSDHRGSEQYKREVVRVFVARGLRAAA